MNLEENFKVQDETIRENVYRHEQFGLIKVRVAIFISLLLLVDIGLSRTSFQLTVSILILIDLYFWLIAPNEWKSSSTNEIVGVNGWTRDQEMLNEKCERLWI